MNRNEQLTELKRLETKANAIRTELGISSPGTVIFKADRDALEDETIIVEADGFGGATARVVVGNYPVDFWAKFERFFSSEEEAAAAAERVAFQGASPNEVLGVASGTRLFDVT